LRSELRLNGLTGHTWWGAGCGGRLDAALLGGPFAVPWVPDPGIVPLFSTALSEEEPPRMLVGPAAQVEAMRLGCWPSVRVVRTYESQPVMVLRRGRPWVAASPHVRRGNANDLDALVVSAAAMH